MKKIISLFLCIMMLCASLTSTTTLSNITDVVTSVGGSWIAYFSKGPSDNQRVVARVHKGYDAVSSTWVYSNSSGVSHPYKVAYQGGGYQVALRGRVDDRDQGPIVVGGTFTP